MIPSHVENLHRHSNDFSSLKLFATICENTSEQISYTSTVLDPIVCVSLRSAFQITW
jgi:hypothetical protein